MRILVITQYFWPENFRVNDLCLELKNRGNDITVLTGKPNYPSGKFNETYSFFTKNIEFWKGIKIYRANLIPRGNSSSLRLFLNYLSFSLFASFKLFSINDNYDKVIAYQLSPGTIGFPAVIAKIKFKSKLYFYIQDLWPESLIEAGGIKSKIILRIINSMMSCFYSNSNKIIVQSEGFIPFLQKKGIPRIKLNYLPNTVEPFYKPEPIIKEYKDKFPKGFNILFAGNLGIAQDFDTIIDAADILYKKGYQINWIIIGNGRGKLKMIEKIKKLQITSQFYFFGTLPTEEMPFYFACADLLLVSLKKSLIFSLTIPSKVQSYMACGKPIIGNIDGITSKVINDAQAGLCSNSGDFKNLANNVELFYIKSPQELKNYSKNSYFYFQKNFERKIVYDKLISILND